MFLLGVSGRLDLILGICALLAIFKLFSWWVNFDTRRLNEKARLKDDVKELNKRLSEYQSENYELKNKLEEIKNNPKL